MPAWSRANGERVVPLDEYLVVVRLLGLAEVADGVLLGQVGEAEVEGHVVGLDDLVASGEPLGDELLEVVDRHVDEPGEPAHDHHVRRPRLAGLLCEFVEGDAHTAEVFVRQGGDGRVEEDDASVVDLGAVLVVGLVVECDEDVDGVAGALDGGTGDARLSPGGASENLGGEGGEGKRVVADAGGGPGQHLRCGYDSLTTLARKADDNLTSAGHRLSPPCKPP